MSSKNAIPVQTVMDDLKDFDAICDRAKASVFNKVINHARLHPGSPWSGMYLVQLEKSIKAEYSAWGLDIQGAFRESLPVVMRQFYDKAANEIRKAGRFRAIVGKVDQKRIDYFLSSAYEQVAMKTDKMIFDHVRILRQISADVLRETSLTGATRREVSKKMLDRALDVPGFRFIDKAGSNWSLKSYFRTLARTELMNAGRATYDDKCADEGFDVMLLSVSGNPCQKCAPFEGRLFSLSGATPGLPTKADLEASGVFHPNCTHSYSAVPDFIRERDYTPNGWLKRK